MDGVLVVVVLGAGAHDDRIELVLAHRERRIGPVEMNDLQGIRLDRDIAVRPFRDEDRLPPLAVGMAQIAEVDVEMLDQPGQHTLARRHHIGGVDSHQLGGDLSHQ